MASGVSGRPVSRGGVVGLSLGRYVFIGGGVACILAGAALGAPEGGKVARGNATIKQRGNTTVIRAGDRAIIDYTRFDIAKGEKVRFVQPSRDARVLNRIAGDDPSRIDGTLTANGRVYIVNPAGVYFGDGALVNVGSIYAAAGNISNEDFLSGVDRFTGVTGDVLNAGTIRTERGGVAALVGEHVANSGVINADRGVVAMVAGDEVLLTERGGTMTVRVGAPSAPPADAARAGVENTGEVRADRGRAYMVAGDMYSLAVNTSGRVRARDLTLEGKGVGEVRVGGRLDARDQGAGKTGGTVRATGEHVTVDGATIDARGQNGGGEVYLGGGLKGEGKLRHATTTTVDASSSVRADATGRGDGGTVVAWSDSKTEFRGAGTARGAKGGGDGGVVETSSKGTVDFGGATVRARGRGGDNGTWLIDPTDVTIGATEATSIEGTLNAGTDVDINTGAAGADQGNITVNAPISKTAGGNATLSLRAANDLIVNADIGATAGQLAVNLLADNADAPNTDPAPGVGSVTLNGAAVDTNGGAATVRGVDLDLTGGSTITANGGITVEPTDAASTVGLGGGGGAFALTTADLQALNTTGTLTIGVAGGTGAITVGSGAAVDLSGEGYDLTVRGGALTFSDGVTLADGKTLTLLTAAVDGSNAGVDVTIGGNGRLVVDSAGTVDVDTAVARLAVDGDDSVAVNEADALEIVSAGGVDGVSSGAGLNVTVSAGGALTVSATVAAGGAGFVTLEALGGDAGNLAVNADVTSGGGDVILRAHNDVTFGAQANVGSGAGPITVTADLDNANTGGAGTGGRVRFANGADLTTTGTATVSADGDIADDGDSPAALAAVKAATATLTSTNGAIGAANGLEVEVGTLTATAKNGVTISDTADLQGTVNSDTGAVSVSAGGAVTTLGAWTGDSVSVTAGTIFTADHAVTSDAGDVTVRAADLAIGGSGSINAGTGDVTVRRNSSGTIGVGDATGDLRIDKAELGRITADALTIGDDTQTTAIRVDNVAAADSQNVATVILDARRDDATVTFEGGASVFNALEARADNGIAVDTDLSADTGDLLLDADADDTADGSDRLSVAASRTISTTAMGGDLTLRASRGGVVGAGNLTINSAGTTAITGDVTADGILNLTSAGLITTTGVGAGGTQTLTADDGVVINGDLTITTGDLSVDADADDDGAGTFEIVTGKTVTTTNNDLVVVGADAELFGSVDGGLGTVSFARSTSGDLALGNATAAGGMTISGAELDRITATSLTLGGGATQAIVVDGVTATQSEGITSLVNLDADTTITFSGSASTFKSMIAEADDGITVGVDLSTQTNNLTLTADDDTTGAGSLTVASGATVSTNGHNLTIAGVDLILDGDIDLGAGDLTVSRSTSGRVGIGGATGDMTISGDELSRIVAGDALFGAGATTDITVRNVTQAQSAGISGTTTLDSRGTMTFAGQSSTFNALAAESENGITVNSSLTTTTGDLRLDGDADEVTDGADKITIASNRSLVSAGLLQLASRTGAIETRGGVTLAGENGVTVDHSLTASGVTTVDADSDDDGTGTFTLASGATLTTANNPLTVTAADANLAGSINTGAAPVTIERSSVGSIGIGAATGDMTIAGAEMGRIIATGLTIGGARTSRITASNVSGVNSNGIAGETVLQALTADGVVEFTSANSTFNTLSARAGTRVSVQSGVSTDTGNLTLNGGALTASPNDGVIELGSGVAAANSADAAFDSPVRLLANVAVSGNDVTFNSRVNSQEGNARTLTVNTGGGGTTSFDGSVGGNTPLGGLITNADGTTRLAADVTTTGSGQVYNDIVRLADDVVLRDTGSAGVFLNGAVDSISRGGARDLTIEVRADTGERDTTIPVISFGGFVGSRDRLGSLYLNYNPDENLDRRGNVPSVATIVVRQRNSAGAVVPVTAAGLFTINVADTFRMGKNEKFTVAGALDLRAGQRAVLGDVSTFGGLSVRAPEIIIQAREVGSVAVRPPVATATNPNFVTDAGVDFVSGGDITFSSAPRVTGSGPAPRFATPGGAESTSSTLDGFVVLNGDPVASSAIDFGTPIRTLDLVAAGSSATNFSTALSAELAGAIPEAVRSPEGTGDPVLTAESAEALADVGIYPRTAAGEELAGFLGAWATYDDYGLAGAGDGDHGTTLLQRLPRREVEALLNAYEATFYRTEAGERTSRVAQMQAALQGSVDRYLAANPGVAPVDPVAFRAYLERTPEEAESLRIVRDLGAFLDRLESVGLTSRELRVSKSVLLNPVRPRGISDLRSFEALIRADTATLPAAQELPPEIAAAVGAVRP